jgi:hypothetical protein
MGSDRSVPQTKFSGAMTRVRTRTPRQRTPRGVENLQSLALPRPRKLYEGKDCRTIGEPARRVREFTESTSERSSAQNAAHLAGRGRERIHGLRRVHPSRVAKFPSRPVHRPDRVRLAGCLDPSKRAVRRLEHRCPFLGCSGRRSGSRL